MRHRVHHIKFGHGVDNAHMMMRKLCNSFLISGHMETTYFRAKAVKSELDRLLEHTKQESEANKNVLLRFFGNQKTVKKLFSEVGPKLVGTSGGFLRIIRLSERSSDSAAMARIEWSKPVFVTPTQTEKKPDNKSVEDEKKVEGKTKRKKS